MLWLIFICLVMILGGIGQAVIEYGRNGIGLLGVENPTLLWILFWSLSLMIAVNNIN